MPNTHTKTRSTSNQDNVNAAGNTDTAQANAQDNAQESQSNSYDNSGATAAALGAFATHSIAQGIQNLHLDPQLVEIGQQAVSAGMSLVAPVRKAYKSNPVLVSTGVATIALGGVLLGLALARDNNISFRQLKMKPKFEN